MRYQDILFYTINILFLAIFLGVLLSGRKRRKVLFHFGRTRKITTILNQNILLEKGQQKSVDELFEIICLEFVRRGEIDYESMIDTLAKIASESGEYQDNVKLIRKKIENDHPFFHVSKSSEQLYMRLENDIKDSNVEQAKKDLRLLYRQQVEQEKLIKGMGFAGFVITAMSLLFYLIEKSTSFVRLLQ